MDKLTRRQSQVVLFVRRYAERNGFAPSLREIADALDVGVNAVVGHLSALSRKGAIRRASRTARGLVVHAATERKPTRRGERLHATTK